MKILLAGYNVDADLLNETKKTCANPNAFTPETFSAAYARISRDPRPIDEIRHEARGEVEKTRRSNETIIFKMGHHSVAEHAVFNFDIIGVSRYVMEALEKFRLCSYTEKSQRYITLEDDFVIPKEIAGSPLETEYVALIREQNTLYHSLFTDLKEYVFSKHADLAANEKNYSLLEGWAKEDARYVTALATEAQVGLTVNARNLELMLRRFASHPLAEVQAVGRGIYELVKEIAPSIIIFHDANDFDVKTYADLAAFSSERGVGLNEKSPASDGGAVSLAHYDKEGDAHVAVALLHSVSAQSYAVCRERVDGMSEDEKKQLFKTACAHMQFYDTLPREFEYAHLTYEMVISAACFGQLKRHRMSTITTQAYDPSLGITIPAAIKEVGREDDVRALIAKINTFYTKVHAVNAHVAPYILTNAHQRRVLMKTSVRELYHISRLREDEHAQWDIREKSALMRQHACRVMPLSCMLIGGKDVFADTYEKVYGTGPAVKEQVLPGIRTIK